MFLELLSCRTIIAVVHETGMFLELLSYRTVIAVVYETGIISTRGEDG